MLWQRVVLQIEIWMLPLGLWVGGSRFLIRSVQIWTRRQRMTGHTSDFRGERQKKKNREIREAFVWSLWKTAVVRTWMLNGVAKILTYFHQTDRKSQRGHPNLHRPLGPSWPKHHANAYHDLYDYNPHNVSLLSSSLMCSINDAHNDTFVIYFLSASVPKALIVICPNMQLGEINIHEAKHSSLTRLCPDSRRLSPHPPSLPQPLFFKIQVAKDSAWSCKWWSSSGTNGLYFQQAFISFN